MRYDAVKAGEIAGMFRTGRLDIVDAIMAIEGGDATAEYIIGFASYAHKSGLTHTLQGFYGRMVAGLMEAGILSTTGDIIEQGDDDEK